MDHLAGTGGAQVGLVYDYWDQLIPCLAAHGYEVDTSKRPSREAYVNNFFVDGSDVRQWFPIEIQAELEVLGGHEDVLAACPDYPPDDVLYGSATQHK